MGTGPIPKIVVVVVATTQRGNPDATSSACLWMAGCGRYEQAELGHRTVIWVPIFHQSANNQPSRHVGGDPTGLACIVSISVPRL
jgi:hypothetical protein